MKVQATSYTFNAVGKTITFSSVIPPSLESILTVVNYTTGTLLFQPQGGAALTGTWASPVLTLAADTSGMSNSNRLLILFEDGLATTTVSFSGTPAVAPNITRGSGIADANTQRVTLASDGPSVTALTSIDGKTPALVSGRQPVDGSGVTQPVSAASLPLPTGAATAANQATSNTSLGSIDGKLPALVSGRLPVDTGSSGGLTDAQLRATAVPVSGPVTDAQLRAAAVPVSAAALPLPSGAATEGGNIATILGRLPVGLSVTSTRLLVDGSGVTQPVSGPLTDTQLRASTVSVTASAGTNLNTSALALESGGNLATLLGRTPALGPAVAASASPVAITTETVSGNITTQNLVPNGAATAGSAVEISLVGGCTLSIQTTGTYTGALSVQLTNDGSRWETITVSQIVNIVTGAGSATIASGTVGIFTFNGRGFLRARVTALGAVTGTAAVTIRTTLTPSAVTVSQPTAANLNATVSGTVTANAGTGTLAVSLATNTPVLAAGTNLAGDVGIQARTNATGAASATSCVSPATPAANTIKGSAGRLLGYNLTNMSGGMRFVKLFNNAAPTLGTTAAAFEIAIPAGGAVGIEVPAGIGFSTAIVHSITSARGVTDNTATGLAAGDVVGWFAFA